MGTTVVFSFPYFGHVNPTVGLVQELANRGEQVYYYTTDAYMKYVQMEGVICRSYGDVLPLLDEEIPILTTDPLKVLDQLVPHKLNKHQKMVRLLLEQVMEDDPDYIIRDCESYWGKMIGTMLDIPVICYITTIALNETMMDLHHDYFVANVFGNTTGRMAWLPESGSFSEYLNEYTRQLSLPYSVEYRAIDAFSGADDLNLVFTSRVFQPFIESFGSDYLFLGPMIREEEKEGGDLPHIEPDLPVIYISMGTVYNDCLPFYRKCIQAFQEHRWNVIMSVGQRISPEELGELPEHVTVRSHVPQRRLLKHVDVFITHGGHNSTNEALYHGVPMLVFPQAADQFAVSSRIEALGAGSIGDSQHCTPSDISFMTERILHDKAYAESCKRVGEEIRNEGGVKLGVDGIFAYLDEGVLIGNTNE